MESELAEASKQTAQAVMDEQVEPMEENINVSTLHEPYHIARDETGKKYYFVDWLEEHRADPAFQVCFYAAFESSLSLSKYIYSGLLAALTGPSTFPPKRHPLQWCRAKLSSRRIGYSQNSARSHRSSCHGHVQLYYV